MKTNDAMQLLECQTPSALARALNISPSAVAQWRGTLPPLQVYRVRELADFKKQEDKQAA